MTSDGINRRQFLHLAASSAAVAAGVSASPFIGAQAVAAQATTATTTKASEPTAAKLPRWRGFNLLAMFTDRHNSRFQEADFDLIKEWGFDFVRLPLSYRCWASGEPQSWRQINEKVLEQQVDEAVRFGQQRGIHVNINFHRAPGYCVNPPKEALDLWTDESALDAACYHWAFFARRYKGIPNSQVSFDLLNEPANIPEDQYLKVHRRLIEAIRSEDPTRLIVADGIRWGTAPVPGLANMKVAQSTRGYQPMQISHAKANWIGGSDKWPTPTWPLKISEQDIWDRQRLRRQCIEPWKALEAQGVGVHVGEWGAFRFTPHDVALAWAKDCLELWQEAGWGWAMWEFRGAFGILDSGREDVQYEDFRGHKLDRKLLELLRQY